MAVEGGKKVISREERKLALFIQTHRLKIGLKKSINNLKRQDYRELQLHTSPDSTAYIELKGLIANFNSKGE